MTPPFCFRRELTMACDVYQPITKRLHAKATQTFNDVRSGAAEAPRQAPSPPNEAHMLMKMVSGDGIDGVPSQPSSPHKNSVDPPSAPAPQPANARPPTAPPASLEPTAQQSITSNSSANLEGSRAPFVLQPAYVSTNTLQIPTQDYGLSTRVVNPYPNVHATPMEGVPLDLTFPSPADDATAMLWSQDQMLGGYPTPRLTPAGHDAADLADVGPPDLWQTFLHQLETQFEVPQEHLDFFMFSQPMDYEP
jgi:hypothetical protein